MREFIRRNHTTIEWSLAALVLVAAAMVWLENRQPAEGLTIYDVFPPLGLVAFGLMWTHFVMGALRRYSGAGKRAHDVYMTVSMGMVLTLIILHPGLLWLGLYLDGLGLPPASYLTAYQTQLFAVLLGSLGLAIFLAFELKRWFGRKSWWRFVEWAQIVGMTAIFFHAIELGGELREDWYAALWWLYGITLLVAIIYTATYNRRKVQ